MPLSRQIAHIENTYKYTQGVRQGRQTNSWRRSSRWTTALGVGWIMDSEHGESVSWRGPGSHDTPCSISCEFQKTNQWRPKKKKKSKKKPELEIICVRLMFFQSVGQVSAARRSGAINRGHLSYSITEGLPQDRPLFLLHFRPRPNELDRWLCHPNPWLAIRLCRKQYNRNRAGESLQEVETAALPDNAAAAAAALHPLPLPTKLHLWNWTARMSLT